MNHIDHYQINGGGTIRVAREFSGSERIDDLIVSFMLEHFEARVRLTEGPPRDILSVRNVCSPAEKENRQ